MISLSGVVSFVIYLVVAGLVLWLLWWLLSYVNPPEPFKKVGTVVLAIVAVLICIGLLLSLVSGNPVFVP